MYMGDLHPCVTESLFLSMAEHLHFTLECQEKVTRTLLSYEYGNFLHKANSKTNHTEDLCVCVQAIE